MAVHKNEEFIINNGKSSASFYLQYRFLILLLLVVACFGGFLLYDEYFEPGLIYFTAFGFCIVGVFLIFVTKLQVEKIVFEDKFVRITYCNFFGKRTRLRVEFARLKYSFRKYRNDPIFGARRLNLYYNKKSAPVKLNSGVAGWNRNDLSEIVKILVAHGVYNRFKFDGGSRMGLTN